MDRDNISALAMAIAVVAVIVGFGIYFNSPGLNKASSSQQQLEKVVSASTTANGTIKTIKLDAHILRMFQPSLKLTYFFIQ